MANLPALTKTYSARGDKAFPDVSAALQVSRSAMFNTMQHLTDTATGGSTSGTRHANSVWTVKGSSDSVTANTSGTNLWAALANLVWAAAGVAHSWIWLENTTLGYQMVIDLVNATDTNANFVFTKVSTPFAGGSTTARPANAAAEFIAGSTSTGSPTVQFISDQSAGSHYSHFVCADDGQFFLLFSRAGSGRFQTFLALQKSINAGAGDTHNVFAIFGTDNTARGVPSVSFNAGTQTGCVAREPDGTIPAGGGMLRMHFGTQTDYNGSGNAGTDAVTGKYSTFPCLVASCSSGQFSVRGTIPDMYHITTATVGSSIPSAAAQERIVAGDFVLPMPGVVPTV